MASVGEADNNNNNDNRKAINLSRTYIVERVKDRESFVRRMKNGVGKHKKS
jgi:hypothetical protein